MGGFFFHPSMLRTSFSITTKNIGYVFVFTRKMLVFLFTQIDLFAIIKLVQVPTITHPREVIFSFRARSSPQSFLVKDVRHIFIIKLHKIRRATMNTFTKKRSYFLSLMVILVVITLGSTAWSQTGDRLFSFTTDAYILNVLLDRTVAQNYLDSEINPRLEADGQAPLTALQSGLVNIYSRDNVRDGEGLPIDSGQEYVAVLFLLVTDPAAPPPLHITLLFIESFNSNQATIDYFADLDLIQWHEASEVKRSHEMSFKNGETKIMEEIDFRDQRSTISLETKFVAPVPYYDPPGAVPDFVSEIPYGLRYSNLPELLLSMSLSRTVYEPAVEDSLRYFKIDGLEEWAGELFNGQDKNDVFRLRYVRQAMVINEAAP
jgi:hypothetical protein